MHFCSFVHANSSLLFERCNCDRRDNSKLMGRGFKQQKMKAFILLLNFKESFFNDSNLGEKVTDYSERSSRRFSSAVGAY